jgi:hypothetical protein
MRLKRSSRFDNYQQEMCRRIIEEIKHVLVSAEAPEELVRDLTQDIAFGITALIDGVSDLTVDGQEVSSVLTFSTGEDELEFAGGNS